MTQKQNKISNLDELEQQAQNQANAGHYKEAVTLYKKLLQQTDNDQWTEQLAYCYLQRAKSFATRDMFKEALVLWDNYTQFARPPYRDYDQYILWVIQTNNLQKIQDTLQQLTAQQLDKDYPQLASALGLLILTKNPKWVQAIPTDSTFSAHLKIVQDALLEPNLTAATEALKALPYRSAFRDIRTLVKAGSAMSPDELPAILDKIPSHSPYATSADLLRICRYDGAMLVTRLSKLNGKQRKLVSEIIGLNKEQIRLIEYLSKQQGRISDKVKFNLAVQFQSLFGAEMTQRFCLALLRSYPGGQKDYKKTFGALDPFTNNRMQAIHYEQQNYFEEAAFYWENCINQIQNDDPNGALKIALILRHMAKNHPDPEHVNELLINSLQYDPNNKDCYLKILNFFSQAGHASEYNDWLKKALDKFPSDIELLSQVMEAAIRNRTYKKAVQYANKILQIDPLHSQAKQTLISGHLNHARKQLKNKKYPLAEKEISQAESLKGSKTQTLQSQLLRSLYVFAAIDKTQGLELLTETLGKLHGDPINMHFQAAIEAQRVGLPVATLLRPLPSAKDHRLSAEQLTQLLQQLKQYSTDSNDRELIDKALEKIKAPLKKSLQRLSKNHPLLLNVCQALEAIDHFELMRHCIKCVENRWDKPIWIYYQIYVDTQGDPSRCDYLQEYRLRMNLDQAIEDKDQRARVLIQKYLDRYYATAASSIEPIFDVFDEDSGNDPIEQLFSHVPEKTLHKIDREMERLFKKTSPEQLIMDLQKSVDNQSSLLLAIMNDPSLFTALMMLRAADDLNIDLGVSVKDVLDYFEADKPAPRSFPFPF